MFSANIEKQFLTTSAASPPLSTLSPRLPAPGPRDQQHPDRPKRDPAGGAPLQNADAFTFHFGKDHILLRDIMTERLENISVRIHLSDSSLSLSKTVNLHLSKAQIFKLPS